MSEPEHYIDASGTVCPVCRSTRIGYYEIPESRRIFERDDATFTDFFGETRDYNCKDCDTEWNMSVESDQ